MKKRINLIPGTLRKRGIGTGIVGRFFAQNNLLSSLAFFIVLFLAAYTWQTLTVIHCKNTIARDRHKISKIQTDFASNKKAIEQIEAEKKTIIVDTKRIEGKIEVLRGGSVRSIGWSRVLAKLSSLVPDDLWISKVVFADKSVTLNGTTLDNAKVSGFMETLDRSGYFDNTTFSYTQKNEINKQPVMNFEINTEVKAEKVMR